MVAWEDVAPLTQLKISLAVSTGNPLSSPGLIRVEVLRGEHCAVFLLCRHMATVRPSFAILVCLFDIFKFLRLFSEFLEQKMQEKL